MGTNLHLSCQGSEKYQTKTHQNATDQVIGVLSIRYCANIMLFAINVDLIDCDVCFCLIFVFIVCV